MEHQHFIPKSYLKNFAQTSGEKSFVDIKLLKKGQIRKNVSISDICVNKNIYTLPADDPDDRFVVEKFYATNVDGVYPEIYRLLTDPNVTRISADDRHKILYTTMSLYFRTPKFLNVQNEMTDYALEFGAEHVNAETGIVKLVFDGVPIEFHISDLHKKKEEFRSANRIKFLATHLDVWQQFVRYKFKCGFTVYETDPNFPLITSDNPVIMRSAVGNTFNVFDPTNIIQLPLDRFHLLTIMPNTESSMQDRIFREQRDRWSSLTLGLQIEQNAENIILGYPGAIEKHDADQKKHGEHTEENLQALEFMKTRVAEVMKLTAIIETIGYPNSAVAAQVQKMRKMDAFQGDPSINNMVLDLAKSGFITV